MQTKWVEHKVNEWRSSFNFYLLVQDDMHENKIDSLEQDFCNCSAFVTAVTAVLH